MTAAICFVLKDRIAFEKYSSIGMEWTLSIIIFNCNIIWNLFYPQTESTRLKSNCGKWTNFKVIQYPNAWNADDFSYGLKVHMLKSVIGYQLFKRSPLPFSQKKYAKSTHWELAHTQSKYSKYVNHVQMRNSIEKNFLNLWIK